MKAKKIVSTKKPLEMASVIDIGQTAPTMVITNPYPKEIMTGDWVCKGKHQYREVREKDESGMYVYVWKCQCDKTL